MSSKQFPSVGFVRPKRRQMLQVAIGGGLMAWGLQSGWGQAGYAQQISDFLVGPPVADIPALQLSPRVWMIYAKDGFPTAANQGMMANVVFVLTSKGVVVIDSGGSLQIGQMAIRMIRKVTPLPVVAVFNSHYHGDHWLGNHAFVEEYGGQLPIFALGKTKEKIEGAEGNVWRSLMERWTNQATLGTRVVAPNRTVTHGQVLDFGDVTLKMHHYGTSHTPADLCVQVVQERVTAVGDIAMANRIANMDDGSFAGTLRYYKALQAATGDQIWIPGHGVASKNLLDTYGSFLEGIWQPCLSAVKTGESEEQAKAAVLNDPRVKSRASAMQGFEANIGKYVSLAYLEAEKEAF
jgi:glyoxylase-like metal-dependent hydrolase (beta-lactamase superfamily II)